MRQRIGILAVILGAIFAVGGFASGCGEEELIGPAERNIDTAGKPSAPSTGDPTVTATVPNTAPQDTTLDVQVSGSGFDRGSRVDLALNGVVSSTVKTNSTRFVNKSTLVANITIAADAEPDLYDVQVTTTKGKRGIGIELFEISYAMTSLGTLSGYAASEATAITETGDIVGGLGNSQPYREGAFIWRNGAMDEIGAAYVIDASEVENRRVVVYDPPSVWEEVGGIWQETLLPTFPGPQSNTALAISPDGMAIVGATGGMPVLWRENAGNWTIESLPGYANDINSDGMIVGGNRVWTRVSEEWISHTLAPFPAGSTVVGRAINDNGDVAGWSEDPSQGGFRRALLWRKTPTGRAPPEHLESFDKEASAGGINNAGQVIGGYQGEEISGGGTLTRTHAVVWTPVDGMISLGSRDTDTVARDINELGQIVGASRKAPGGNFSGDFTAVLWELQ